MDHIIEAGDSAGAEQGSPEIAKPTTGVQESQGLASDLKRVSAGAGEDGSPVAVVKKSPGAEQEKSPSAVLEKPPISAGDSSPTGEAILQNPEIVITNIASRESPASASAEIDLKKLTVEPPNLEDLEKRPDPEPAPENEPVSSEAYEKRLESMSGETIEITLTKTPGEKFGFNIRQQDDGIFFRDIEPDTLAEKAGLKAGDWVWKVNGKVVAHLGPPGVVAALVKNPSTITILVRRPLDPKDFPEITDDDVDFEGNPLDDEKMLLMPEVPEITENKE